MDNFEKPTIKRQPRLNLAIGPNCPVRCGGVITTLATPLFLVN